MWQQVSYWISHLYLTDVAAAQLRWHLPNMNVIQKNSKRYWREIKNFAWGKITNGVSVTPTPKWQFLHLGQSSRKVFHKNTSWWPPAIPASPTYASWSSTIHPPTSSRHSHASPALMAALLTHTYLKIIAVIVSVGPQPSLQITYDRPVTNGNNYYQVLSTSSQLHRHYAITCKSLGTSNGKVELLKQ